MFGVAIIYFYYDAKRAAVAPPPQIFQTPAVIINDVVIPVEIAEGMRAVQKGLSGRPSLNAENGMLFLFSSPARYRFWMPDMRFPIDIIWINNETVVDISHDVPNNFNLLNPHFYRPKEPARYVLEVNAGFARKKGIEIGSAALFKNISRQP